MLVAEVDGEVEEPLHQAMAAVIEDAGRTVGTFPGEPLVGAVRPWGRRTTPGARAVPRMRSVTACRA